MVRCVNFLCWQFSAFLRKMCDGWQGPKPKAKPAEPAAEAPAED